MMGEPDHAADLLGTALALAAHASAPRAVNWVRHSRRRWLGDYDEPAVRRLDEALQTLAPTLGNDARELP